MGSLRGFQRRYFKRDFVESSRWFSRFFNCCALGDQFIISGSPWECQDPDFWKAMIKTKKQTSIEDSCHLIAV